MDEQRQEQVGDFYLGWRYVTAVMLLATKGDLTRQIDAARKQAEAWDDAAKTRVLDQLMNGSESAICFKDDFISRLRREAVGQLNEQAGMPEDPEHT